MGAKGKTVLVMVLMTLAIWGILPMLGSVPFLAGFVAHLRLSGPASGALLFERISMITALAATAILISRMLGKLRWSLERSSQLDALFHAIRTTVPLSGDHRDPYALIHEACRRLAAARGYYGVWIGLIDADGSFETAVQVGWADGFGDLIDGMQRGKWPPCASHALSEQTPAVMKDTVSRCSGCPLRSGHYGRGALAVRIQMNDRIYGVLCASAPPAIVMSLDEQAVLKGVARDLAYSLHTMEAQAVRVETAAQLKWERELAAGQDRAGEALLESAGSTHKVAELLLEQAMRLTSSRRGLALRIDRDAGAAVGEAVLCDEVEALPHDENGRLSLALEHGGATVSVWNVAIDMTEPVCMNPKSPVILESDVPRSIPPSESLLAIPVRVHGLLSGELVLASANREYGEREMAAVSRLARMYGAALQKADLERSLAIRDTAVSSTADAMVVFDAEGRLTDVNGAFLRAWGHDGIEGVLGTLASDLMTDPHAPAAMIESLRTSGGWHGHLQAKRKDGSVFPIEAFASAVRDSDGCLDRCAVTLLDVSQREFDKAVRDVFASITRTAAIARDLNQLYRSVRQELGAVMSTRNFFVALHDPLTDMLTLPLFLDEKDQSGFDEVPAGKTLSAYVARSDAPLLASRDQIREMVQGGGVELVGTPADQWMGVPLRSGDEVLGVMAVQSYDRTDEYDERHLELLLEAAAVVAAAIARDRAEHALRESEGRFSALSETMSDALINTDSRGNILMWNKAAEKTFGYPAAEAVGQSFSLIVPEGFLQAHVDGLMRAVASEGQGYVRASVEGVGLRKDESEFPMALSIGAWKADDETFFTAVLRDVTAAKQAEEELQFLGSIPLQVSDALIVTDLNYRITYVNKAAEFLFGYPAEEIIGKTLDILCSESWEERLQEEVRQTVSTGRVWSGALKSRRKNSTTFSVEMRVSPLRDSRKRLTSFISIFHDLTERRRAAQLLQTLNAASLEMERNLAPEQILNAVSKELHKIGFACAVFLTEDEEQFKLRYDSGNENGSAENGRDRAELMIRNSEAFRRVISERQSIFIGETSSESGAEDTEGEGAASETLVGAPRGTRSILAPLIAGERISGVLSVQSEDLTRGDIAAITAFANQLAAAWLKATLMDELSTSLKELKRTQDILLHAQKMEAIGNLAGGVAHDFNNLLTAIRGYAELALGSMPEDNPIYADITQIKKASDQAASLTSQLLAFGRQQPLEARKMNVNEAVTGTDAMLRRLIGEDVELVAELQDDLSSVVADPTQVQQVIMNLVINARDAMSDGGTLTISTANVMVDEEALEPSTGSQAGKYVRLSVEDSGSGIEPAVLDRIFEPFFTTKEMGKGTGLGLSVVYGIVTQHGGYIDVESELGSGTAFHVYIPATEESPDEQVSEDTASDEVRGHGERILVVEDETTVRDFAVRALRENGYRVVEAADAEEALVVFESDRKKFDLVFSDVVLPSKSGVELAEELLSLSPNLRILLSSGYADRKSQWSIIQEKGLEFVKKPYAIKDLLKTIRGVIEPS